MYLRHEAGHAFNYAYGCTRRDEWRELFGAFRRPYRDDYRPGPSRAATCATSPAGTRRSTRTRTSPRRSPCGSRPRSNWRKRYQGWGALKKLRVRGPRWPEVRRRRAAAARTGAPTSPSKRWRRRSPTSTRRRSVEPLSTVELPLDTDLCRHLQGLAPPQERRAARRGPDAREPPGDGGQADLLDGRPAAAHQEARPGDRVEGRRARAAMRR